MASFDIRKAPFMAFIVVSMLLSLVGASIPSNVVLRVLPVGDSITAGTGSSDQNGYRLDLSNLLLHNGNAVSFIGTQVAGLNNPNNHNEGYGGYRINAILNSLETDNILTQQPNVVLIHAGTNDNDFELPNESYAQAPARLANLIDYMLCNSPDAVVMVAKLIDNQYNASQTALFNAQVPRLVWNRRLRGYKIGLVDMTSVGGSAEKSDLVHPNDAGYKHMAQLWYSAMEGLPTEWFTPPKLWVSSLPYPSGNCPSVQMVQHTVVNTTADAERDTQPLLTPGGLVGSANSTGRYLGMPWLLFVALGLYLFF